MPSLYLSLIHISDLRESYRREREQEKERYRNEIIGYHGSEEGLETLLGYQLFSIGNRADSAALAYQVDYVLDLSLIHI